MQRQRAEEAVDEEELEDLEDRDIKTDSTDYENVPAIGAYITVKVTKETGDKTYRYYY